MGKKRDRVLRFAVTGALLIGAPACGGAETHSNEPAPEHTNEPANPDYDETASEYDDDDNEVDEAVDDDDDNAIDEAEDADDSMDEAEEQPHTNEVAPE